MQKKTWFHTAVAVALLHAFALGAYAQDVPAAAAGRNSFGFEGRMSKAVGLTPEQRDTVKGLMAEQRQQRTAIQEQTDGKIRALLNPEQQKKFDAFLSQQKQFRASRFKKSS